MPLPSFFKFLAIAMASISASEAGHIQPRQRGGHGGGGGGGGGGGWNHDTTTTSPTPSPTQAQQTQGGGGGGGGGGGATSTTLSPAPVSTSGGGGGGGGSGCSGCSSSQYSISFSGSFSYDATGDWGSSAPASGCQQSSGSMCFCLDGGQSAQNPGMVVWAAGNCEAYGTKFEINVFADPSTDKQNTLDVSVTDAYSIPMTCTYGVQSVGGTLSGTCPDQQTGFCKNDNGHTGGPACPKGAADPVNGYFTTANYWYWDCNYVAINWETLGGSVSCSVGDSSSKEKRDEDNSTDLMARDELAEPMEVQAREQAQPLALGELGIGFLDVAKRHARKFHPRLAPY